MYYTPERSEASHEEQRLFLGLDSNYVLLLVEVVAAIMTVAWMYRIESLLSNPARIGLRNDNPLLRVVIMVSVVLVTILWTLRVARQSQSGRIATLFGQMLLIGTGFVLNSSLNLATEPLVKIVVGLARAEYRVEVLTVITAAIISIFVVLVGSYFVSKTRKTNNLLNIIHIVLTCVLLIGFYTATTGYVCFHDC